MPTIPQQLQLYREMAGQSVAALDAAQREDWEALAQIEGRIAALRDLLQALPTSGFSNLPPEEALEIQGLMESTLARLNETRLHVQPHRDELRELLGDASTRRRVDAAYGQGEAP